MKKSNENKILFQKNLTHKEIKIICLNKISKKRNQPCQKKRTVKKKMKTPRKQEQKKPGFKNKPPASHSEDCQTTIKSNRREKISKKCQKNKLLPVRRAKNSKIKQKGHPQKE